ncbi:MAG: DUF1385 domain-containing protein [Chloroflexota bacterium]|nr:DUF1385 domain-containing protein [Chloroflexota bacterium]MDE2941926.1 DUF1385 domain-containing protein [Chloroflexota bacterium]MDE3268637.1 DUF1385 domain-containing protein [Chloroflexota bacterium]
MDKGQPQAQRRFVYGGQAVIEGVMIRGRDHYSLAVRKLNGEITTVSSRLSTLYTGRLRSIPLVRGVIVLLETLIIGIQALSRSANIALEEEGQELSGWSMAIMLTISLTLGIGLFFIAPLFAIRSLDSMIESDALSNLLEGILRLAVFLAYILLIGLLPDIKRVFAYHGAEHMTVHAQEHELPLEVENVRRFPTAHNRCGTAFLLVVMVVAIAVFTFIGRPSLPVSVASRIVLVPVIAAISYEIIRFSGAHATNPLVKFIVYPSLALQSLTTRKPDDAQIEVAIRAMEHAIAVDQGIELPSDSQDADSEGMEASESEAEEDEPAPS